MPQVPFAPADALAQARPPASPTNYLMAAAEMKNTGQLQQTLSAPVPTGHDLQTSKAPRHRRLKVVR